MNQWNILRWQHNHCQCIKEFCPSSKSILVCPSTQCYMHSTATIRLAPISHLTAKLHIGTSKRHKIMQVIASGKREAPREGSMWISWEDSLQKVSKKKKNLILSQWRRICNPWRQKEVVSKKQNNEYPLPIFGTDKKDPLDKWRAGAGLYLLRETNCVHLSPTLCSAITLVAANPHGRSTVVPLIWRICSETLPPMDAWSWR